MRRLPRAAFTLVELLVVIAILALLIALLLPAVQMVRHMSYKSQCNSNMRQLGLAINNYESSHNTFPLGRSSFYTASFPADLHAFLLSGTPETPWLGQLLSHLDMDTLASEYNQDMGVVGIALGGLFVNSTVMQRNLPGLNCPADVTRKYKFATQTPILNVFQFEFAMGNYVACWGNTNVAQNGIIFCMPTTENRNRGELNLLPRPSNPIQRKYQCYRRAAFGARVVRRSDVTDGLSKTIFMSELIKGKNPDARGFLWLPVGGGNVFMTRFLPNGARDIIRQKSGQGLADNRGDQIPSFSGSYHGPPNTLLGDFCFNQPPLLPCSSISSIGQTFAGARSRHPGGVTVLLGDASVQFVSNQVDMDRWVDAGSIDGDESTPEPW